MIIFLWDISNDLLLQWDYLARTSASKTITYPIAYNDFVCLYMTTIYSSSNTNPPAYLWISQALCINNISLTNFTVGSNERYYLALGV